MMRSAGRIAWIAPALVGLVTIGCGYHLAGKGGGVIPEHIRAFVVVAFENRTKRPEIEQRVTEEVALQLSKRGRYSVVAGRDKADGILEGAITDYRAVPITFSDAGLATRVEVIVTIQATLRDLSTDEVLWSQAGLVFRDQFDVPETEEFFDQENIAIEKIARGAASALVSSILEGF